MQVYRCDGCGREMKPGELRYDVRIEVRAAYDEMEISLADLVRDHRAELAGLIERMGDRSARDIEETIWKAFSLHLCPSCQRAYIKDPLRIEPGSGTPAPVDIDEFLRSLRDEERRA